LVIADLVLALLAGTLTYGLLIRRWPPVQCGLVAAGVVAAVLAVTLVVELVAARRTPDDGLAFLAEVFDAEPLGGPAQLVVGEVPWEPAAFQPRPALLARVEQAVASGHPAVLCNLAGTSGVGKTQVAGGYARARVEQGCPLVVWVNAETSERLVRGLAAAAHRLGIADPAGDSARSAQRLRDALAPPALLVLDDASDVDAVRAYLPREGVEVLITTTQRTFDELGRLVEVEGYEREEAVGYLLAATGREEWVGAGTLARALAYHPLALAQAAAVVQARRLTFVRYGDVLAGMPPVAVRAGRPYPRGAAEAISLSVLAAEEADPDGPTGLLLGLLAVLSTDGVPRAFLDPLPVRGHEVNAALRRITDANLAGWAGVPGDPAGDTLVMHRLVARVIRERAHQAGELPAVLRAATALLGKVAGHGVDVDERAHELAWLLPEQAAAVWDAGRVVWRTLKRGDQALADIFAARRAAVTHLIDSGDLTGAATYGAATLHDAQRFLGPASPDTRGLRSILAGASGAR
jgi:hypothetical protein